LFLIIALQTAFQIYLACQKAREGREAGHMNETRNLCAQIPIGHLKIIPFHKKKRNLIRLFLSEEFILHIFIVISKDFGFSLPAIAINADVLPSVLLSFVAFITSNTRFPNKSSNFNFVFAWEDGYPLEPRLRERWFKK